MSTSEIKQGFPNLTDTSFRITSQKDRRYNCIAWAADNQNSWWEPSVDGYWPMGVPRTYTLEAYIQAFLTVGYLPCSTPDLEAQYDKVAIYVDVHGRPTHMARQLPNGRWTSKLGKQEDIEHNALQGVSGSQYGAVAQILRRSKPTSTS